ncbi:sigma-E factor negative regulatory protein [Pseudoduganella sp. UC29_71]|uniref:sigma-E factor negative regulatory protein n=1 Tax=Pseudoduganella sp. UC29_71 TaxID=3350174 RepID=UPI00366F73BA
MDTLKRLHEHISAMVDGELSDHEAGLAVAALTEPEGQAAWRAYHLIGDVLRSDASGAELGEGFSARLAARLDVEVAPGSGRAAPAQAAAVAAAPAAAPAGFAGVPGASQAVHAAAHGTAVPASPASVPASPASSTASPASAQPAAAAGAPVPDTAG